MIHYFEGSDSAEGRADVGPRSPAPTDTDNWEVGRLEAPHTSEADFKVSYVRKSFLNQRLWSRVQRF